MANGSPAQILPAAFYSESPDLVAQKLLGKLLVRGQMAGRIVEVEAYFGKADPAAHAFAGKTERTAILFGPPGRAYVYLVYGLHYCLNVSCEPEGMAGCVLFRALEPVRGLEHSASGPGRLCKTFGITRPRDNGTDLTSARSNLQVQDDGYRATDILVTPRIGISKDSARLARYLIAGNPYVSSKRAKAADYQSDG